VVNRVISSLKKVFYRIRRVFCSTILELKVSDKFLLIVSKWVLASLVETDSGFILYWSVERIKFGKPGTILRIVDLILMNSWGLEIDAIIKPWLEDIWSISLSDLASCLTNNLLIGLHFDIKFKILFNLCE